MSMHESDSGGSLPKIDPEETQITLKKPDEKVDDISAFENIFEPLEDEKKDSPDFKIVP